MNFLGISGRSLVVQSICAIAVLSLSCGCTSRDSGSVSQSYKGVVNLEAVRLGMSEETAKGAVLSFVPDPSVQAPSAQYLSRSYDQGGGQYCLSYNDGKPKQLRVVYSQNPISKEEAIKKLKSILPASAPEETKVDDSEVKAGKKPCPVEHRFYGPDLKAEIIYADKSATSVKLVAAANVEPKQQQKKAAAAAADETKKK